MKNISIRCENCYFAYSLNEEILKDLLFLNQYANKNKRSQNCLKNISFDLKKGEKIGVIGLNGSGKSSLLLALSGNLTKKFGYLEINNVFQLLFEMGDVDSPLNTGYQIIESYYYMLVSFYEGNKKLAPLEIYKKEVAAFSELNEKLNQKFLTYSSGMKARLLYSMRAVCNNQYFLIDEILSVGDNYFTEKCIRNLRSNNIQSTGIYVSHDWSLLSKICSRFLWLENGKILKYGKCKDTIGAYVTKYNGWLEKNFSLFDKLLLEENVFSIISLGEYITLKFTYENSISLQSELSLGLENIDSNKGWENILLTTWTDLELKDKSKGNFKIKIAIPNNLMPGNYEMVLHFKWIDQNKNTKVYTYSWFNKKSFTLKLKK